MGVEHDGLTFAIYGHGCVARLSTQRFFFSHQMDDTAWKEKLLEPSGVWEKGGENSPFPFALNQKPVRPLEKACPYHMIERVHFSRQEFL
jgi:hypothetical protein